MSNRRAHSRPARSDRALYLATLFLVTTAQATACKKNDGEVAAGGYTQGQIGAGGVPGAAGASAVPGRAGAPAAGAPAVAGAAGAPTAAAGAAGAVGTAPSGPTAQRLDVTAAAALQPALNQLAKQDTQPGMKPVGETLVGNFQQGQTLETQIQLVPNKCYSVVATGFPPVAEVNVQLQLLTPVAGVAPVLAIDSDSGPTAVLGRKATCYKWMLGVIPAPARVVVQVTAGSGLVAAQAYEK